MSTGKRYKAQQFQFMSHSIFDGLPQHELEFLTSRMHTKPVKKGLTLFIENSVPTGIFYLIKGKVKKYKINREGKEQIIYICSEGELLGYPALLSEESYSDSAATLEDCVIGFIEKDDFLSILNSSSILSHKLLKNLSHEFAVLENLILTLAHQSVRERLALTLLILHDKYKNTLQPELQVNITLSRQDLANMVGTAMENTVRLLKEFKSERLIETEGKKIRLLDFKQLVEIANLN